MANEGNHITCEICKKQFKAIKGKHLKLKHNLSSKEYKNRFPNAKTVSPNTSIKTSKSMLKEWDIRHNKRMEYRGLKLFNRSVKILEKKYNKIKISIKSTKKGKTLEEFYGINRAREIRKKQRDSHLGKVNAGQIGRKIPEHVRKKIRETVINKFKYDKEFRKKYYDSLPNRKIDPETEKIRREKIRKTMKGRPIPNELAIRRARINGTKPNKKEIIVNKLLNELCPNNYKYCGDAKAGVAIKGKIPDWININGKKQVILFNGIYWHLWKKQKENPNLTKNEVEIKEKKPYNEFGFDVLFIWEDDLESNPQMVESKIKEFAEVGICR